MESSSRRPDLLARFPAEAKIPKILTSVDSATLISGYPVLFRQLCTY